MTNGKRDLAVYLSGNGPLVAVLTEALARDKQRQEKEKGNIQIVLYIILKILWKKRKKI